MRKPVKIYDDNENRFIPGEFRSVCEVDFGAQLGYFESSECANKMAIMVLYPDGTYSIFERLEGRLASISTVLDRTNGKNRSKRSG